LISLEIRIGKPCPAVAATGNYPGDFPAPEPMIATAGLSMARWRKTMRTGDTTDGSNIDVVIDRSFDAPARAVFDQWITADALRSWFAPDGFEVTLVETNPVPGGRWQSEMRTFDGNVYLEYGEYRDILPGERLVLTLTQGLGAEIGPRTIVSVDLVALNGRTEMHFMQEGLETVERRDENAEGWRQCFDKLEARLAEISAWTAR
jgi:uncharacterized protein YndB with AHSA1/START domain